MKSKMIPEMIWYVRVMEVIALGLGGLIAYLAYRAYRRGGGKAFLLSAMGFTLITTSSFIEGFLYEFLKYTLLETHIVRSTVVVAGFLLLVYSIVNTK